MNPCNAGPAHSYNRLIPKPRELKIKHVKLTQTWRNVLLVTCMTSEFVDE